MTWIVLGGAYALTLLLGVVAGFCVFRVAAEADDRADLMRAEDARHRAAHPSRPWPEAVRPRGHLRVVPWSPRPYDWQQDGDR